MKFALPRLLIGLPLLAFAVGFDDYYFMRCILGIVGVYIIGRLTNYGLHSFGMLIAGIVIYFPSMTSNSFDIVSLHTTIDQNILQLIFRLIGSFMIFVGFYNPNK